MPNMASKHARNPEQYNAQRRARKGKPTRLDPQEAIEPQDDAPEKAPAIDLEAARREALAKLGK